MLDGDTVLVLDPVMKAVRLFSPSGAYVRRIGGTGNGPGELRRPGAALARGDTIYLFDGGAPRVVLFTSSGEHLESWRTTLPIHDRALVLPSADGVWAAQRLSTDPRAGMHLGFVRFAQHRATADTMAPPDPPDPATAPLASLDEFRVGVGPADAMLLYDIRRYVLRIVPSHGEPLRFGRADVPPHRRTDREIAALRDAERARAGRSTEPGARRPADIPAYAELIRSAWTDEDGRTWVEVLVNDAEWRDAGGVECPAVRRLASEGATHLVLDLFARDGALLGRIAPPCRAEVQWARGDSAWGVVRDTDDVPAIVRWRIDHTNGGTR